MRKGLVTINHQFAKLSIVAYSLFLSQPPPSPPTLNTKHGDLFPTPSDDAKADGNPQVSPLLPPPLTTPR